MGCDIHTTLETRAQYGWRNRDNWTNEGEDGEEGYYCNYDSSILKGRNYSLFGMLANVRNGLGFAGIKTGEGLVPIFLPRGAPVDVAPETRRYIDQYGEDGHSHSHATLAELLAYDMTRTTTLRGVVSAKEFHQWEQHGARKRGERPPSYRGGILGRGVCMVSEDFMRATIKAERARLASLFPNQDGWKINGILLETLEESSGLRNLYVDVEWTQHYYELAHELLNKTIPTLLAIATREGLSYDDVRIVFYFDN